jgi:hypothetical protein
MAAESEAEHATTTTTAETKVLIQPLLEKDANRFIVVEGRRLRNMLVRFYYDHMDDMIESAGMTCGQMLDLFLAEEASPTELAATIKGDLVESPKLKRVKQLKYLGEMSLEGTWGDQIMLLAFAEVFKQPVHVYQIDTTSVPPAAAFWLRRRVLPKLFKVTSFGDSYEGTPMTVLYHGNHYSALLPKRDTVVVTAPPADASAPAESSASTDTSAPAEAAPVLGVDFHLLNVPGDGNCLFSSLRLAMEIHEARVQMEARPDLFDVSSIARIIGKHVKAQ